MPKHGKIPVYDKRSQNQPQPKSVYEEYGFRNPTIDKFTPNLVKDVEKYNPKTGKSEMIYKPGKK
jgi:hypothetical protein